MSGDDGLLRAAERALAAMRAAGLDAGQATARRAVQRELNVAHDEPSLLRSTDTIALQLTGLVDGRRATAELSSFDADAIERRVAGLAADARAAPQDDANAVSSGQCGDIAHGPLAGDIDAMAERTRELLDFRAREAATTMIEEAALSHVRLAARTLTSGGSDLACEIGWYEATAMATARDGGRVSSFAAAGGTCDTLDGAPLSERFSIGDMLVECGQQLETRPFGERLEGEVVLEPAAVEDLVGWLLEQIGDTHLIAGTSVYKGAVGRSVASPLFTLASRFDAPGVAAVSGDGFATPEVVVVRDGRLETLAPSLYGSRKTGIHHVPLAGAGWQVAAGTASRDDLVAGVHRGALVGRLSMGKPTPTGDFSGVVKNGFALRNGARDGALSETMVTGNVARMLQSIVAVGRDRVDCGRWLLPRLRIEGLVFS